MIKEAWKTNKAEVKARLDKDVKDRKVSKSISNATLASLFPERRKKKPVRVDEVARNEYGRSSKITSSMNSKDRWIRAGDKMTGDDHPTKLGYKAIGKMPGNHTIYSKVAAWTGDQTYISHNDKTHIMHNYTEGKLKKGMLSQLISKSSGKGPKHHDFYHHLMKSGHVKGLVADDQSPGAVKVWHKLSKKKGVDLHGWSKGKPVNLGAGRGKDFDEDETHAAKSRGWGTPTERGDSERRDTKLVASMREDAPVNAVGGGNIAGTGIGPDGEPGFTKKRQKDLVMMRRKTPQGLFAGKKTFKVPHKMFTEMKNPRADRTWWKKTVGEDYIGEDIREFANANPREPVILEDEDYGWMHYLRYGKE